MITSDLLVPDVKSNGRDGHGRFTVGNSGGPGNPFGGRVAKFRKLLMEALTDEDMKAIVDKLLDIAKEGNLQAIKLVLGYTIGKPGALPQPREDDFSFLDGMDQIGTDGALLPDANDAANVAECPGLSQPSPLPNGDFCNAAEVSILPETSAAGPRKGARKLSRRERKRNK